MSRCVINTFYTYKSIVVIIIIESHIVSLIVDGGWSEWSDWSQCTVSCGNGTRTRSRTCNNPTPQHNGKPCEGPSQDVELCSLGHCPGKKVTVKNVLLIFNQLIVSGKNGSNGKAALLLVEADVKLDEDFSVLLNMAAVIVRENKLRVENATLMNVQVCCVL